jgi:hypothetical protein
LCRDKKLLYEVGSAGSRAYWQQRGPQIIGGARRDAEFGQRHDATSNPAYRSCAAKINQTIFRPPFEHRAHECVSFVKLWVCHRFGLFVRFREFCRQFR